MSVSESPDKGCRILYPGPPTLLEQERSARLVYLCQLTSADGLLGKPQPGASLSDFRGCLKMGSPSSSWKNCSQRGSGLPKLYLYSESYNILDDGNESERGAARRMRVRARVEVGSVPTTFGRCATTEYSASPTHSYDPVTLGRGGRVMWERGAESFQGELTHRGAKCDLARRSGGLAATQG